MQLNRREHQVTGVLHHQGRASVTDRLASAAAIMAGFVFVCAAGPMAPPQALAGGQASRPGSEQRRLQHLWETLAAQEYREAHEAARALAVRGEEAVAFIQDRLKPVSADPARIANLVGDLGDESYAVRVGAGSAGRSSRSWTPPPSRPRPRRPAAACFGQSTSWRRRTPPRLTSC